MSRNVRRSHSVRGIFVALILSLAALTPSTASASESERVPAQVALDWNLYAVNAVRTAKTTDGVPAGAPARSIYQTEGLLYTSYAQAAVYDAVMKITHRYRLYHNFHADAEDASPRAAAISAAYNTLVFYLGDPGSVLAGKYAASIAALGDEEGVARGVAVGQAAAADLEQLRANDGRSAAVSDACPSPTNPITPGAWLCPPPPSVQFKQTPWMAVMQPFMLRSASQFRAPAPPALDSATYLNDLSETRAFGAVNSTVRTPAQRDTAWFWNGNAINQINQALRDFAVQNNMDLANTVRLLAAGDMVSTDAGIACFDSKYHWLLWRPITAIRNDGNPDDAAWSPLVTTPNHPEYPSQHGCVTSAVAAVLANAIGSNHIDATIWGAAGGASTLTVSRSYGTVEDLMDELVNARVWIGFHYRNSVHAGENLGTDVAGWELRRYFQPGDEEGE